MMYALCTKLIVRTLAKPTSKNLFTAVGDGVEENGLLGVKPFIPSSSVRLNLSPQSPRRKLPNPSGGGRSTFLNAVLHSGEIKPYVFYQ